MKKLVSLVLAVCLAIGMMATMSGCFGNKLVGKWEADIDMRDYMLKELGSNEEINIAKYLKLDSFNIPMIVEFGKDGKYNVNIDEKKFAKEIDKFKGALKDALYGIFKDMLKVDSNDAVDVAIKAQGMSMEDLMKSFDSEVNLDSLFDKVKSKGKYEYDAKDGELSFEESGSDDEETWTIKLKGDKFKVTDYESDDDDEAEMFKNLLPITFEKQ
ncbi:MAG: hypothetical protein MJ080_00975 [Clostridia bacterium]|nr:hypothetical protein [Clostridia bacterium]